MHIESLSVTNFRCFEHAEMEFQYPGRRHGPKPAPRLDNVNLLLGDNGTGKSAVLKAIALAVLAEIIQSTGFRSYFLVRRTGKEYYPNDPPQGVNAEIRAELRLHTEDIYPTPEVWEENRQTANKQSVIGQATIKRRHALETVEAAEHVSPEAWEGLFVDDAPALFLAGYGATRRVENTETFDTSVRDRTRAIRYQRVAGLFEDYIGLTPLRGWIDSLMSQNGTIDYSKFMNNSDRFEEGIIILNRLLPEDVKVNENAFVSSGPLFLVRGTSLPFAALSDGYRAFIGWVGDLLFHLSHVTPTTQKLTDLHGVVMVDELDLLLHPAWQRTVIDSLAKTFPRLQFFFTSHSPILAGTLEAANIFVTEQDTETGAMTVLPGKENVHGLSADQILTSSYFDLPSPRAPDAVAQMNDLARNAWEGDTEASQEFLRRLTEGFEPVSTPPDDQ